MRKPRERNSISCIVTRAAGVTAFALVIVLAPTILATASSQWKTYNVLYAFTGGADGANPLAGLVLDSVGNLYGTTFQGGTGCHLGCGVIFNLDTSGTETVLYTFPRGMGRGVGPWGTLAQDAAGTLYGVTWMGGGRNFGTVFKLYSTGEEMGIHTFLGEPDRDGANPEAGLIRDKTGNLYGTTSSGGGGSCPNGGCGTVFKVSKGKESVLYSFSGPDGAGPRSWPDSRFKRKSLRHYLFWRRDWLRGPGCGVVFEVDSTGKESVLYSFTGRADGEAPLAGLVRDSTGHLYGTTFAGGASNAGTVFKLNKAGKETVLYSFMDGADGAGPEAGLIRDSAGNLYGTTAYGGGGTACSGGCGTVFKLDTTGHETLLHSFAGGADGALPEADLVQDSAGNLYGTTYNGGGTGCGGAGCGVVFEVSLASR